LALKKGMNDERGTAVALVGLGGVSQAVGAYERAQEELREAIDLAQGCGDHKLTLEALAVLAALAEKRGMGETAVCVLTFILAQEAAAQEVRDNAERFLTEARGGLSVAAFAAAQAAGAEMDLEAALACLQAGV
jgi:tetratricopeptide (TPR) repeat protein